MHRWILVGLTVALTGCGEPTIDTSSATSFKQSMDRVEQSLPEAEHTLFQQSIEALMMHSANPMTLGLEIAADPSAPLPDSVAEQFDNKSGREIIALARPLLESQREKDLARYQELLEIYQQDQRATLLLSALNFTDLTFSIHDGPDLTGIGIDGQLHNGTDLPLHRFWAEIRLVSPERSAPWMVLEGFEEVPGGIESGETRPVDFHIDRTGGWRPDVELPDNIQLEARVTNFTTADGTPVQTSARSDFSRLEFERLREKYGEG